MPPWLSSAPRKKLPPPMTTAIWVPSATTSAIWRARERTTLGSTPMPPPPNTSPDSLSSTRRNGRGATSVSLIGGPSPRTRAVGRRPNVPNLAGGSADLEVGELRNGDAGGVEHLLDRLLGLLDRLLLEQDDLLEEAVQATLDDLGQGGLGLALGARGLLGDAALGLDDVGRHL